MSIHDETEADTRAERIDPVLAAAGWGKTGSKVGRDAHGGRKMQIIFKTLRRLVFPAFLVISLTFNGLLLVSTTVFSAASAALGAVTGFVHPHLRAKDDLARLKVDLDDQKRINRELRTDAASLSAQVATSRAAEQQANRVNRELRSEAAMLSAEVAASRAAQAKARTTVANVTQRVSERSTKAAVRDTAAMAGEAIPVWGVAVIVAATSLEIYDLCQTVIDMNELQEIFDPSLSVPEEDLTVCSMEVPSRAELWETTSAAPAAAWASVQGVIPTIDDISTSEFLELDWTAIGQAVTDSASSIYEDATGAVDGKWEQLKNWWDE